MKVIAISQRVEKIVKYNEFRDQVDNRLNFFVVKAGYLPVPIPNFIGCDKPKNSSLLNWLKNINPDGIILSGGDDFGVYKSRDKNEIRIITDEERIPEPFIEKKDISLINSTKDGLNLKHVDNASEYNEENKKLKNDTYWEEWDNDK